MLDLVFNELSTKPVAENDHNANTRLRGLVRTLAAAAEFGLGGSLRVPETFSQLDIAEGYTIYDWTNARSVPHDERLYVLQLATKTPYLVAAPDAAVERAESVEVTVNDNSAECYRAAILLDVPLVSLCHGDWDTVQLPCVLLTLHDSGDLPSEDCKALNVSRDAHLKFHEKWIRRRISRSVVDMHYLWEHRTDLFPHLELCESIREQLYSVRPSDPHFQQILSKLFELEEYFSRWRTGGFDARQFSKCNPASPETLARYGRDYTFISSTGEQVVCGWHLYLTPSAWRMYFYPHGVRRAGIVGHIGTKLPDVTYGRS